MADDQNQKSSAYGGRAGAETSFRRTWDREAYAAKAAARETTERAEGKARYEAKLAGKKYHAPPASSSSRHQHSVTSDKKTGGETSGPLKREGGGGGGEDGLIDARSQRLDVTSQIGKTHILTGAQASLTGRRGRGAGFYCEDCDLTFKDNLQWVDHLNSRSHFIHSGQNNNTAEVRRATLMEVRERLLYLREKQIRLEQERKLTADVILEERLKSREEELEKERQMRREKRRERRQRGKEASNNHHHHHHHQGAVKVEDHVSGALDSQMAVEGDVNMASMMGFQGFGTTKT